MEDITTPREKILKKVRQALLNKPARQLPHIEAETSGFVPTENNDAAVDFAAAFTSRKGGFIYCHNFFDFVENFILLLEKRSWKQVLCPEEALYKELKDCGLPVVSTKEAGAEEPVKIAITGSEAVIGRSGAVLFSSRQNQRKPVLLPEIQLVIAYASHAVPEMKDSITLLKNKYGEKLPSLFTYLHGPGTAYESDSNPAAAGPAEMIVFLINDR